MKQSVELMFSHSLEVVAEPLRAKWSTRGLAFGIGRSVACADACGAESDQSTSAHGLPAFLAEDSSLFGIAHLTVEMQQVFGRHGVLCVGHHALKADSWTETAKDGRSHPAVHVWGLVAPHVAFHVACLVCFVPEMG